MKIKDKVIISINTYLTGCQIHVLENTDVPGEIRDETQVFTYAEKAKKYICDNLFED